MGKQQEKRDGDMNGLPETIADIIAEMRRGTKLLGYWHSSDLNEILAYHADRLEAAHKREKEAAERHKPGNAAVMREALKEVRKAMILDSGCGPTSKFHTDVDRITQAALTTPPRNCDVGTVDEQAKRMDKFCNSHRHGFDGRCSYACANCKFITTERCELSWAQMPYEKGGRR